jgi:hypothetical protein
LPQQVQLNAIKQFLTSKAIVKKEVFVVCDIRQRKTTIKNCGYRKDKCETITQIAIKTSVQKLIERNCLTMLAGEYLYDKKGV